MKCAVRVSPCTPSLNIHLIATGGLKAKVTGSFAKLIFKVIINVNYNASVRARRLGLRYTPTIALRDSHHLEWNWLGLKLIANLSAYLIW